MAERFADAAVHKRIAVDLALIEYYEDLLSDLELHIVKAAQQHDAHRLDLRHTVPGIGNILRLVLLYEMHDIPRFPSVQDFVAYGRLGKGAKESAGTRDGTSGTKSGHASLTWAFSQAAGLFRREHAAAQQYCASLENNQSTGQALTSLAQKLARAVYDMLKRGPACEMPKVFHGYRRGAGEPGASLDGDGMRLAALCDHRGTAALNAHERLGRSP